MIKTAVQQQINAKPQFQVNYRKEEHNILATKMTKLPKKLK